MAGSGVGFTFHGAFTSQLKAEAKARELKRRGLRPFVRAIRYRAVQRAGGRRRRGGLRFLVLVPLSQEAGGW